MATKRTVNWKAIGCDYRAGILSIRDIGRIHGVTHQAISKHAKKHGWERDLRARVREAARAVLDETMWWCRLAALSAVLVV